MKRVLRRGLVLAVSVAALIAAMQQTVRSQGCDVNVIVKSGDKAPNGLGTYKSNVLHLNGSHSGIGVSNAGVTFRYLVTDDQGQEVPVLVISDGESTNAMNLQGMPAPSDFAGKIAGNIISHAIPVINNRGEVAFYGGIKLARNEGGRGSGHSVGIFRFDSARKKLTSLFRAKGSSAEFPRPKGVSFSDAVIPKAMALRGPPIFSIPVMNDSGQVIFDTILPIIFNTEDPSPKNQNSALFVTNGTESGTATLAQASQIAAGLTGITNPFFDSELNALGLTNEGEALFSVKVSGTDDATGNRLTKDTNSALVTTSDGRNFRLVTRQGQKLPNREGCFGSFESLRTCINNKGQVVFHCEKMLGTDEGKQDDAGIFVSQPGKAPFELVSKNAPVDPAKPERGKFSGFSELSDLTDSGLFVFFGEIKDADQGTRGLFLADINKKTFTEIIRAGDPSGAGGTVTNFPGNAAAFSINKKNREFSINEAGQLMFVAEVDTDPGPRFNLDDTLFYYDKQHGLKEILRSAADFAGGKLDTLFIFPAGMDDSGRCVCRFKLVDGSRGIAYLKAKIAE